MGSFFRLAIGIKEEVFRIPRTPRVGTDVFTCRGTNSVSHEDHVIELIVHCKYRLLK